MIDLVMSCPCCAGSFIDPAFHACRHCQEGDCESQGGTGKHLVEPLWCESDDTVCDACGCVYAVRLTDDIDTGRPVMGVVWICDDDEDLCSCDKHE